MNKFNQLTPEIVYWATGRTKIYPEKEFASNYRKVKSSSEKKQEIQKRGQSFLENAEEY